VADRIVRSQRAAVVEIGDDVALVGRDGSVARLTGDSAALAREVIAFVGTPVSRAEVHLHIELLAGPLAESSKAVVDQLLDLLAKSGAVSEPTAVTPKTGINVVLGISGAIAASHAPALLGALLRRGHAVEVAMTPTAQRFAAVDAMAAIAQREPHTSMWPRAAHVPVPHVALAEWAELVVVYPASATTIARIANGDFSDLVAAIALTTRAPVVLVPSMNTDMLGAPAVQRNLEQLRADGFVIVGGVPSHEVADAPSIRTLSPGAAPAPAEVVATIEALRPILMPRLPKHPWEDAYRNGIVPWARDVCDPDIAAALAKLPAGRVLDVGCGLGQVAKHAAARGHRVVATDISETALRMARDEGVTWVRDDFCATALLGPFDVVIDRATLHTLTPARAQAWAASLRRVTNVGSTVIVKTHRDGIPAITSGWTAERIAALLPDFAVVLAQEAELPGIVNDQPIPAVLVVLRRER
jgi:SAM-dependent methyltransferase/3-polyprenyl-4-hydroxybenzoate decarboxylase